MIMERLQARKERPLPLVSQPQTLLAGVAEPSENASRLGTDAEARLGLALSLVGLAVLVSEIEGSTTGGEVYF